MGRIDNPVAVATTVAKEYASVYGDELLSVTMYGSAAGGDFDALRSDINLLLLLRETSLAHVERSLALQTKWLKSRVARPLFLDTAYIESSLDSFPIEFLNMRGCYTVIAGADPLATLNIKPAHVRLQAERELKGMRLHLIQQWLDVRDSRAHTLQLASLSLKDFAATFRALLFLKQAPVPGDRAELCARVEECYGLSGAPFSSMQKALRQNDRAAVTAAFPAYIDGATKLMYLID